MRKFTFLLTLLMAFMTTAMAQIDTSKEYRVKHTETGNFMIAGDYEAHPTGPTGGVKFVAETESDDQVFLVETEGTSYKLKTKSGKYIYCQAWNVDALDEASALTFRDNGDGTFKLKCDKGYFKVEFVGDAYYPFCDAALGAAANFELVEVVATTPEVPEVALAVESVYPDFTVRELSEITVNFNAEIAGQFDPYSMTAMKFKKGNSVAAGVDSWTVEGNKLTVTLSQTVTEAGEYTLVIPEGLITRKSDGAAYSGELTFTLEEEPVAVPDAELAETYNGKVSINYFWSTYDLNTMIVFGKDENGAAKEGYATLKIWDYENFNMEVVECVPYEVNGNTVVLKGVTVGAGDGTINTKNVDLTFTVQEDGTMTCQDKVYGPTPNTSIIQFDFSAGVFTPEATTPEVPEVPAGPVVITDVAQLSNAKCYTLVSSDTGRGGMYALADKVDMCGVTYNAGTDACHSVALDNADPKQQFAFVEYEGKLYLYSVSEKKFVMKSGDTNALVGEAPFEHVVVEKVTENTFALQANGTHYFTASPGWCANPSRGTCIQSTLDSHSSDNGWDNGAWYTITEVADFDATEALAMLAPAPEVPEALELVSIEPADGAQITEFNTVTFTFNKPVKLVESDETGVLLMYNGTPAGQLWGEVPAEGSKTVVLSMGMPVNYEGTYTVYAMEGAFEDLDGNKSAEIMVNYTLAGAQDGFTYTYAVPTTDKVQSSMSYITLGFASEVAEVKTDAINVVDGKGNVVTTATLEADWFDPQAVSVTFAEEVAYTGTCSLTVPAQFITSTLGTYNPEFTLTYNLEAEAVEAYFYHPEYNAVMVMDSVANVATIKRNFTEEELAANAWELHPVGKDQYLISNKATGLYLGSCKTSVTVAGVDAANAKVYELQKNGIYDVFKDVEGGSHDYLHVAGHNEVVGWEAASAASHWFVLNSVEDYAYLAANLELVDSLTQLVKKAEELKEQAQPYYKPLITDATQFNSNNQDPEEGSYAALLDGDNTTFFHSNWHGGGPEPHDLQVMLPNNDITEFLVKYESRNSSGYRNDRPVKMSIYGGTRAEDGTVTFETTAFANLTTADGIGEVVGEFKFTADKVYDAFKFEVHETVMTDGTKGKVFFTYGEFQMYSQALTPAEIEMTESQAAAIDEALANAKNANPVEDSYSVLIEELNRAINKVLFPAATVEAIDPACGHYTVMPGTLKLTFSADVNAIEWGMFRTDLMPMTMRGGYQFTEDDYTINGKELTLNLPAEYVDGASMMQVTMAVIDANGQYVTYSSDPDYTDEDYVTLMYSADVKYDRFKMTAVDPEEGVVEKLDVVNVTFGDGNTFVGGFDPTSEVVVLDADNKVVSKVAMEVVMETEVDPDTDESFSWPTSTVKFTLETPVTEAGEYTLFIPQATVYNEGFYEDAEDFGASWGAIYNPEIKLVYTVEPAAVEEYPVNFDKDQDATRYDRVLSTVSLAVEGEAAQVLTVANTRKAYNDMTAGEVKFVCAPGATLTPAFDYSGVWMHGYVYVDFGQDGDFSFDATQNDQTGKDLVSYSFYGVDSENYGYNSANEYISGDGRSTLVCPAFTAPETPGEYRVRFKVDWNNVDAGGCVDSSNHILNNGGYIVDATLVVDEATAINGVSIENMNDVYTLDGRKVVVKAGQKLNKGLYIVGGKKVYVK